MRSALHVAVLSILASFCASSALANCVGDDPTEIAKSFFTQHANFHFEDPVKVRGLVTSRFFTALEREHKCSKGELCAIEAVPWTDAQDGDIGEPIAFESTARTSVHSVVRMSYTFVLSKSRKRPQSVSFMFQRKSPEECWLLSDLIGPRGKSLVAHLEKWHKEYGNGL